MFKKKQKYQINPVFTEFHHTNLKGLCADRCSSFDISLMRKCYHGGLYYKAWSNCKENYYCFNETDFMFGFAIYISYPNFTLLMLMILRLQNLQTANKISKGPLILVYMHVFEWDIVISNACHHLGLVITALLRHSIHER